MIFILTLYLYCLSVRHPSLAEPCQPVIVSAQALCNTSEVHISWHQAADVENYLVVATGSLGHVSSHNSSASPLRAQFPCGQHYRVSVQARGLHCNSAPSSLASFTTGTVAALSTPAPFPPPAGTTLTLLRPPSPAPCTPRDLTTYVECELSAGSVSWGSSDGARTYTATATGLDGHAHPCHTNATYCSWDDLHCGEEYTVVVRANGDNCSSRASNSTLLSMSKFINTPLLRSTCLSLPVLVAFFCNCDCKNDSVLLQMFFYASLGCFDNKLESCDVEK